MRFVSAHCLGSWLIVTIQILAKENKILYSVFGLTRNVVYHLKIWTNLLWLMKGIFFLLYAILYLEHLYLNHQCFLCHVYRLASDCILFAFVPFSWWRSQLPEVGLLVWRRRRLSQSRAFEVSNHHSQCCLVTQSNSLWGWKQPRKQNKIITHNLHETTMADTPHPMHFLTFREYAYSDLCLEQFSLHSSFIRLIPFHLSSSPSPRNLWLHTLGKKLYDVPPVTFSSYPWSPFA